MEKSKKKHERQRVAQEKAKKKQQTKEKPLHARTNDKRDDIFTPDESMEYCLTDIPESRQLLIYQQQSEFLNGPLESLVEHHKSKNNAQSLSQEYIDQNIWPELKMIYRFAEIMQRQKGDVDSGDEASWESSCK